MSVTITGPDEYKFKNRFLIEKWFAWFPAELTNGRIIWLKSYYRLYEYRYGTSASTNPWRYRYNLGEAPPMYRGWHLSAACKTSKECKRRISQRKKQEKENKKYWDKLFSKINKVR